MWVFWVLFLVTAILLCFWMVRIERARLATHVKEYQAAAAKMGVSYTYDAPDTLLAKIKGFDLTYADGDSLPHRIRDVFVRRSPIEDLFLFLHEYRGSKAGSVGGGGHRESVGCIVSKRLQLPRFRLAPERLIEKLASIFGFRDVDFESRPEFSRSYFLNGKDEVAVRDLFDSTALDFFEAHPGLYAEGNADTLVIYRFNKFLTVDELPHFLETVKEVAGLFKR